MRKIVVMLLLLPTWSVGVGAQTSGGGRSGDGTPLVGRVVDAEGGTPLAGAEVVLVPVDPGEEGRPESEDRLRDEAVANSVTDAQGGYRFDDVAPGVYLVEVERLGYRSVTVRVQVGHGARARVSVALRIEPIELQPLAVSGRGAVTMRTAEGERIALGRVAAERLRQSLHLSSDARVIAAPDLREAATLGETDVFRAIQRLPGVATRDDYTAELWTRGGSWGETRVYLDGIPLFNPVHGAGLLSGVSHRGLGATLFHPGARPVRLPEGGAAILELSSESGAGADDWTGGVDLTLASIHGWARGPLQDGSGGWSAVARRSYADVLAARLGEDADDQLPYVFSDVLGRVDLDLGSDMLLSLSGLVESDAMTGEIPDVLHGTEAHWGNAAAQATLAWPMGHLHAQQSVGATYYRAHVREIPSAFEDDFSAPSEPPADHAFLYVLARGELAAVGDAWRVGYDLIHQSAEYEGPQAWPYSNRPPDLPRMDEEADLTRLGLWGERRWSVGGALEVQGMLRADGGSQTAAGRVELQPSLVARLNVAQGATISAGLGRYVQYAQSPAPVGPRIERALETGRLWVLSDERRAPLQARIATLGGEIWLGSDWIFSGTGYIRRTDGILLPDATEGLLVQRPPLVTGAVTASGFDMGLRRLAGRLTGSVGYSLGHARAEALGVEFPAPTDRRHVVDLTTWVRISRGVSAGAAYAMATGAPYARTLDTCVGDSCRPVVYLDDPFGRRGPTYSSLDLVLDWTRAFDGWSVGAFIQARNLLGNDNAVTYDSSEERCPDGASVSPDGTCMGGGAPAVVDRFTTGIPTLPLLGFRVVF